MEFSSPVPDNLTELLVKIIQFTERRRDVLYENIHNTRTPGYTPRDLPVLEFAGILNGAIAEHLQHQRLLFCDTENVRFGQKNIMGLTPVPDDAAEALLQTDRDQYMELQVGKLLENSLNRKVAKELLRLKCGNSSALVGLPIDDVNWDPFEPSDASDDA